MMEMNNIDAVRAKVLSSVGFSFERGGAHVSRTIMLDELISLFEYVDGLCATKDQYAKAIIDDNCLGKRSVKTRNLTFRHLVDLYGLNLQDALFRAMLFFWQRDIEGRPLISLLAAYARDSILRSATKFILESPEGSIITRESLEQLLDNCEPARFSAATLKSTAQNINSSFTKSGHLHGKAKKVRIRARATGGSVSYALFLGYLCGARGKALFETEFFKVLDCSFERAVELAVEASRKGWIITKRIGAVIEVLFPNLIKPEELERIHG